MSRLFTVRALRRLKARGVSRACAALLMPVLLVAGVLCPCEPSSLVHGAHQPVADVSSMPATMPGMSMPDDHAMSTCENGVTSERGVPCSSSSRHPSRCAQCGRVDTPRPAPADVAMAVMPHITFVAIVTPVIEPATMVGVVAKALRPAERARPWRSALSPLTQKQTLLI